MKTKDILNNIIESINIDWSEAERRKKQIMKNEDIQHHLTHMFRDKCMNDEIKELKFRTFKVLTGNIIKEGYDINLQNINTISQAPVINNEKLEVLIAEGYVTKYKNKTESMIAYYNYVINK